MATVQKNALKLLQVFYERTHNGNAWVRIQDAASPAAIYLPDAEGAARYLAEKGLIQVRWLLASAAISPAKITASGIDQIEAAQMAPDAPLHYFPSVTYNTINLHHVASAAIQQATEYSNQTQSIQYSAHDRTDFARLAKLLRENEADLSLGDAERRKLRAQVATIEAQLLDEPDPSVMKQVGKSLRTIAEGAISNLIAAAVQPNMWTWAHALIVRLAG